MTVSSRGRSRHSYSSRPSRVRVDRPVKRRGKGWSYGEKNGDGKVARGRQGEKEEDLGKGKRCTLFEADGYY